MSEDVAVRVAPMRVLVAEEIRVLLARRRMSASELARRIGATQPYISRRLTGDTAFDVDDLGKIAEVLGVTARDLLGAPSSGVTFGKGAPLIPRQVTRFHERPPMRGDATTRPANRPQGQDRPVLIRGNSVG